MQNKRLRALLREAHAENIAEQKSEKLFLIEDIVKIKKTLFAFGDTKHDEFTNEDKAGQLFNILYEYNVEQLTAILEGYTNRVNHLLKQRIKQY